MHGKSTKTKAYSYLRFSTADQAKGDSYRRQIALAEDYAKAKGLELDKSLTFQDLGVSAFTGKNRKKGALRAFLDAVEEEIIPAGSFLLVESLDRVSREAILDAQATFLQIVNAGITLVTLKGNPRDTLISRTPERHRCGDNAALCAIGPVRPSMVRPPPRHEESPRRFADLRLSTF